MAKLKVVGAGPGSPEYVTPAARNAVQKAEVVIGAQRSITLFNSDIKGKILFLTANNLIGVLKQAAEFVNVGKEVVLLSTGDPGFSGLAHTVAESGLFQPEDVVVVAGVSSIQACAAKLGISWDKACLFTFHEGNVTEEEKNQLISCLKKGKNAILLPNSKTFSPKEIAAFLIKSGIDRETRAYVCENITLRNEEVTLGTLERISQKDFGSLSVMVIK